MPRNTENKFIGDLKSNIRSRQIRTALAMKGWSQRDLAAELGVHESAISMFISGKRNSKKFRDYIDRELGVAV